MAQALSGAFGPSVRVTPGNGDFLGLQRIDADCVITNPPYGAGGRLAVAFIGKALSLAEEASGQVAMLLKVDFDSGRTRNWLFGDCTSFAKKVVLRRRIMWFPSETGCGPSENHAWFIWDWRHSGPATIAYGP
jgi:hypothetical protein